ncbi:MAG: HD domain-containing protein [Candidatus Eisenbacteria bacterium]
MAEEAIPHGGQFIDTLKEGDRVTEHYRVLRKSVKTSRTGEPYLDLDLGDRTGYLVARLFQPRHSAGDTVHSFADIFQVGDIIRVSGRVDLFQGKLQLILDKLRLSREEEYTASLFERASDRPVGEMEKELREAIDSVGDEMLRELVRRVFDDAPFYQRFTEAPAATRLHHAYRHGLIEHTLSLFRAAEFLRPNYPELDWDLVRVGVLLHDIGKTEELGKRAGEEYTVDGTLQGHVYLGARRVESVIGSIEQFPEESRRLVLHLILSHHGEREFGAPIEPATREAVFLHQLDNLDAKLANARETLAADRNEASPFTDLWASGAIGRRYYKGTARPASEKDAPEG